MDKDIMDSLNNAAKALEHLAKTLKQKNKENVDIAKMSNNTVGYIEEIRVSINEIKEDTKEILKNQKNLHTIVQNQEKKKNIFSAMAGDGENKGFVDSLKKGVGNVLLIAAGILAIGTAFMLIGNVDFLSVIALGITMPLIAIAFSKISEMEGVSDISRMGKICANLLLMSGTIVATSYILSGVTVVSIAKLITATAISGMMYLVAHGMVKLSDAIGNNKLINLAISPVVMVTSALAIAWSSSILQLVTPVAIPQLITSIGIAGIMGILGMGIGKLSQSIGKMNLLGLVLLPMVMVTSTYAIALSSQILTTVTPVAIPQLISAVAISGIFYLLSYSIAKATKSLGNVSKVLPAVVAMPFLMAGMSLAVAVSSHILVNTQVVAPAQLLTAVAISATFVLLGYAAAAINTEKIKWTDLPKFPLLFGVMALAVTGASHVLQDMTILPPAHLWGVVLTTAALSVSAVMFGGTVWAINKMGLGIKDLLLGGAVILGLSGIIAASSHIIALGNYDGVYPSYDWSLGVGLSMLVFGAPIVALGFIAGTGAGAIALAAGAASVVILAAVIAGSSHILAEGNYVGGPNVDWAKGTGMSLLVFGAATVALGAIITATLGVGALAIAAASSSVLGISQTIVDSSHILAKGNYKQGPTVEWSKSVSMSLAAFSSIYKIMAKDAILSKIGMGVSVSGYKNAIITICDGIKTAANNLSSGNYNGGPSFKWASGVSLAISAFAPVYAGLGKSGIFDIFKGKSATPEEMQDAIRTICASIVSAALFFNLNSVMFEEKGAPSKEWSEGVGNAIKAFAPVFEFVSKNDGWFSGDGVKKLQRSVIGVASAMVVSSQVLAKGKWDVNISDKYIEGLDKAIVAYINMEKKLTDSGVGESWFKSSKFKTVAKDISELSTSIDKMSKSLSRLTESIDLEKLNALKTVNGTFIMMSLMDNDNFDKMLYSMESKSGVYAEIMKDLKSDTANRVSGTTTVKVPQQAQQIQNRDSDMLKVLMSIDKKLSNITDEVSTLSDFITGIQNRNILR